MTSTDEQAQPPLSAAHKRAAHAATATRLLEAIRADAELPPGDPARAYPPDQAPRIINQLRKMIALLDPTAGAQAAR